jgi:putative phosphonate metabolism protein
VNDRRYAIYFAPEDDTALARFGWPWLGRRPENDADAPFHPAVADDRGHAGRVADSRLYGLHGTLRPPFHLGEEIDRADLIDAMAGYCASRRPFAAPPLVLDEIDGFIALRPSAPAPALDDLAADCVTIFDRFRAPPTAAETARRLAQPLTTRQRALLERWGYPFVLDEFRFHVTLTGRLADAERTPLRTVLAPLLRETVTEPLRVESLCLFEQPAPGARFILAARLPFGG